MNIFGKMAAKLSFYKELTSAIESKAVPVCLTGVSNIHKAHIISSLAEDFKGRRLAVLCDDEASSRRLVSDINTLAQSETAVVFPAKDLTFANIETASYEYEQQRIEALSKLSDERAKVIVFSSEAALQSTIPPSALSCYTVSVSSGSSLTPAEFAERLLLLGYSRAEQVDGKGQFSQRGDIIDVFPVSSPIPIRIELWGDEIDTISTFDTDSQRRLDSVESVSIPPAKEIIFSSPSELSQKISSLTASVKGKHADDIKKHLFSDLDLINGGVSLSSLDKYYGLCYDKPYTVLDYCEGGICVVCEAANCREKAKTYLSQLSEDMKILYEEGILFKELSGFYIDDVSLFKKCESLSGVFLDTFMRGGNDMRFKKLIAASAYQASSWGGDIRHLIEELETFCERKYTVVVLTGSDKTVPMLVSDLRESKIKADVLSETSELAPSTVYVGWGAVSQGFEYPDAKCALISQLAVATKTRKVKKHKKGEEIRSLADISEGDLVVHSLYGIGRFSGISKITTNGVTKDYITIKYAGTDVLYVPVTQLDLVSRYIGPRDDDNVKLNKLNSTEWTKTRTRVKTAVKDMAAELIKLYAQRQTAKGFAFSPDSDWQIDFEERFEYQETDDQLRAIDEIKADMQKPVPMDRLLCGDVGFGKTEVALRAAFKCILDSKQCAILVPTTVLAWQHYQTAVRRFEHFPIKVQLLSRYRTPKEQEQIIKELNRGEIDLIIGTHRIISKDVKFKDLGLVIIDEEQRFGVAHKEKLKELFKGVDVLTLSATPIPRTLNMAMSGIRDMSIIEEPPQDRYPVQTYVIEHNHGVIIQAINKELRRGGQVYYIHNRIESIEACASKLARSLPDARIGIVHGQMPEEQMSEIWRQLIDREIDILVCTTIIETGVDVPNVNTLIIENADNFGLSQLYQLRGRVGRSNKRAYAYFTFRRGKVLTEVASKRLNAIRELTQFGSGFRIALRDLEIRGAGSILSGKQHGHMEAVGYDMYLRLLNEAIAEEKGEAIPRKPEDCLVDITIDAYIPNDYIESLTQRIDAYRRIAMIQNKADSEDVLDELIDRYGDPPKPVIGLVNVALLRNTASALRITEITQRGENLLFYTQTLTEQQLKALSSNFKGRILFNGSGKSYFSVKILPKQKTPELMAQVLDILSGC